MFLPGAGNSHGDRGQQDPLSPFPLVFAGWTIEYVDPGQSTGVAVLLEIVENRLRDCELQPLAAKGLEHQGFVLDDFVSAGAKIHGEFLYPRLGETGPRVGDHLISDKANGCQVTSLQTG